MPIIRALCFAILGFLWLGACETKPPIAEGTTPDATQTDTPVPPPDQAGKPDTPDLQTDKPTGKGCLTARDCPEGDCIKGACVRTDACQGHSDCNQDQRCFEDRCVARCDQDTQCPAEHVCTDGVCHKPDWKVGKLPNEGSTTRKAIRVGLGVSNLDFPLGVSMAGYGFRPGPRGPYAKSLGASEGMYDRFNVKALVLDDGVERIVLVRSPLVFTTDFLLTQACQRIIEKTGIDLTHKIIITSTHSHSAPARFWNLLPHLNFGSFGGGDFLPEVFSRLVDSFVDAIIKAQDDLKDGKIGYVIDPNFDPEGRVFSDRRGENPDYKEPRLLVFKVERADGTPIAVLVNFPMHGTISDNTMLTNDAAGGLEFKVQDRLEALEQKRIEVFFMQGAAGDVSPRGDHFGHKSTQMMQMLGTQASIHIEKLYKTIQTKSDVTLEIINKRVPLTYKELGYKEPEYFTWVQGEKVPYRFGAFQCVKDGIPAKEERRHEDGKLGCIFSIEVVHGAAVPQFSKTRLTAARIGDLILATFPGENTSHLAKRLREGVEKQTNGKLKDIIVLGYSQDHQLYITGETDWWHGGYEASTSVWGPKMGEYILKHAIELTSQLATDEKEKNDTGILPQDFYQLDLKPIVPREQTPDAGKVAEQPPKQYMRMNAPFKFTISGGFHGVDNPHIVLQRQNNGTFEDVKRTGGRLYDEFDYRMMMTFEVKEGKNLYTYYFQELEDFPAGTYRFRAEGNKWDGSKRVPYTLETDAFEIVASDKLKFSDLKLSAQELRGWVAYPAGTNDNGGAFDEIQSVGHRLRSHLVPWVVGPPLEENAKVELTVKIEQGGQTLHTLKSEKLDLREVRDVTVVNARDKDGKEKTTTRQALSSGFAITIPQGLASGTYQVTVTIKDPHGNTGTWGPKDLTIP